MYRNYQQDLSSISNYQALTLQTAFHESGHAAGIYIGNKEKKLPPVFFQIQIKNPSSSKDKSHYAKVVDGRLIQHLPVVGIEKVEDLTYEEQKSYRLAYEADVINLLIGSIAEARYVSERDDELFSINLLNVHALNYYGGHSDVKKAYAYLKFFITSEQQREVKMREFFLQAFQFVENDDNWNCIQDLAEYILKSKKEVLSCEEAVEIFDKSLVA